MPDLSAARGQISARRTAPLIHYIGAPLTHSPCPADPRAATPHTSIWSPHLEQLKRIDGLADSTDSGMKKVEKTLTTMEKVLGVFTLPGGPPDYEKKNSKQYENAFGPKPGAAESRRDERVRLIAEASDRGKMERTVKDGTRSHSQRLSEDSREDEIQENMATADVAIGGIKEQAVGMGRVLDDHIETLQTTTKKVDVEVDRVKVR